MVRFARGEREQADQALQQLIANFGERIPVSIATVYAFRREPNKMFEWLERAYQRRQPNLPANLVAPVLQTVLFRSAICGSLPENRMPVPKSASATSSPTSGATSTRSRSRTRSSAWLLIQLASILFPTFDAPAWVMKVFIALVAARIPHCAGGRVGI